MLQVTVIGSSEVKDERILKMAEELGEGLAKLGAIVICGGKGGVMEAVCKGAKKQKGITVGILPDDQKLANPYVDIAIVTGMGEGRNVINVKSGDLVIVIGGGAGTLSEIGLALKANKKVIALAESGGVADLLAGKKIDGKEIIKAKDIKEIFDIIKKDI